MLFYNEKIFKRCFHHPARYWYKNIKYIPLYFKLMHHLIKHGYDEYATWETFDWFIDTMKEILTVYRSNHNGYPVFNMALMDDDSKEFEAIRVKYDGDIDHMIKLLDAMDECSEQYKKIHYTEKHKEMNAAKDEFFKMFSEYFYDLWD